MTDTGARRPRLLLTNDDGVDSPGLQALLAALQPDYDVVVAAPANNVSGAGTGIGRFDVEHGVGMTAAGIGLPSAALDGPPGLAVMSAALGAFGESPDLVVSGVNAGINTGHSVIHSGTVGAVLTARTFGMCGLALSLARSDPWQWEAAVHVGVAMVAWMLHRPDGSILTLNVNVPARPVAELQPARWADLDEFGYFRIASPDVGAGRIQFEVRGPDSSDHPTSDTSLVEQGHVTVTPLTGVEAAPTPEGARLPSFGE